MIDNIVKLIDSIPIILSYIVYGYIFLAVYNWISFRDNTNFNNMIIKSIAASYVLMSIFKLVTTKLEIAFTDVKKTVILICISAVLGAVLGKISSHQKFNDFLLKLHINRTTNKNIWDDAIRPNTWVRVFMNDGSSYLGLYKYGEQFKSEPVIVLISYQQLDESGNVIVNNANDGKEAVMLNTKNFEKIELTYTE